MSNSDNLEVESGVESATGDVTEAELLEFEDERLLLSSYLADLDLTTEQAQETLKYFSEYLVDYSALSVDNIFIHNLRWWKSLSDKETFEFSKLQ